MITCAVVWDPGGTCNCLSGRPSLEEEHRRRRRHFEPLPSARSLRLAPADFFSSAGDGDGDVPDPTSVDDLFGGLLTIGTLGIASGPIEEEDSAADFEEMVAVEAIAEKAAEATTETDLMVVSAKLEKVLLMAEAAEEKVGAAGGEGFCSARTSHVSAGRASAACPLQGYLFGSPIEMAETTASAGERREKRASLGELFLRSRLAEDGGGGGVGGKRDEAKVAGDGGGGGGDGEGKSTAGMQVMMRKMLKRRGNKGAYGGPAEGSTTTVENKFQKILQMFHRKVHPESCITIKKNAKPGKKANQENCSLFGIDDDSGYSLTASAVSRRKENILSFNCCSNPATAPFSSCDSSSNREHWIKTDAEYLVLEL